MRANVASAIGTNSSALKAASPGPSQNGGPESNGSQSSTGGSPKNGGAGSGNGHAAFMPRGIAQFLAYRAGHALGAPAHGKSRS